MKIEKLEWENQVITNEFYYDVVDFSKKEEISLDFFKGLKKIFDFNDPELKEIGKSLTNITEDQYRMLAFLDNIMDNDFPTNKIVAIFTNYLFNAEGERNIVDELAVVYQITNSVVMVCRLADYTLTDFAKSYDITKLIID